MSKTQLFKKVLSGACACLACATALTACNLMAGTSSGSSQPLGSATSESSFQSSSLEDSSATKGTVVQNGITYTLNEDGLGYTVTGYNGVGGALTIAGEIQGLPVTTIGVKAFFEQNNLTAITIPDSVRVIENNAFSYCEGLTGVVIPDGVTKIESHAFAHCHGLVNVKIGDGVTELGAWSFYYGHSLTSVIIGDSVRSIGTGAFQECFNLQDVVLGVGVQNIEGGAFGWCNSLANVYYKGGTGEWLEIQTGGNTELTMAKRYYYVEDEKDLPASGNYWHYNENGEIAVW